MTTRSLDNQIKMLHFQLKNTHVCVDIRYVDKIISLLQLEPVPNSPPYLAGLMSLEEKIIPVIDLAMRLGMHREQPYTIDIPILLCTYEAQQAGLIIDKVMGLVTINKQNIQMHEEFNSVETPFIGSVTLHDDLSLLLNMNHIFPLNINIDLKNKKRGDK
ncbi:MAG: chemotaxis protein CheW [Legionellales bacterium]|nr:chemotaxis protein CheW [Legionellales bacterium]